jgi:tRNA1(Val) A37 N6-methylase TrmN6
LKKDGRLIVIHRADALPIILAGVEDRAGVTLMPVLPRADRAATRILVRMQKDGHAPFVIAPPLILHEEARFTATADAIHRGAALIDW